MKECQRILILCSVKSSVFTLCVLGLVACATSPTVIKPEMEQAVIHAVTQIRLLFPDVTVERISDEHLPDEAINIQEIAQRIQRLAAEELQHKGLTITALEFPRGEGHALANAVEGQDAFSLRLVRVNLAAATALDLLQEVCGGSTASAILVHSLQVKIGPEGRTENRSIPPFVLLIVPRAGMRTSYLRAVLRDCGTGGVLWRNEVFLQVLPQVGTVLFEDAVRGLYRNLWVRQV